MNKGKCRKLKRAEVFFGVLLTHWPRLEEVGRPALQGFPKRVSRPLPIGARPNLASFSPVPLEFGVVFQEALPTTSSLRLDALRAKVPE